MLICRYVDVRGLGVSHTFDAGNVGGFVYIYIMIYIYMYIYTYTHVYVYIHKGADKTMLGVPRRGP